MFSLDLIIYTRTDRYLTSKQTETSGFRAPDQRRQQAVVPAVPDGFAWFIGTVAMLLLRIPENFNYPYETPCSSPWDSWYSLHFSMKRSKLELNMLKVKKEGSINLGYSAMMVGTGMILRIMLDIKPFHHQDRAFRYPRPIFIGRRNILRLYVHFRPKSAGISRFFVSHLITVLG
ncbi:MAG: hypothetical protein MZV49_05100 [Rhodopseudomonas palustris]|nr:hypothetical protein [Rhodopseudomonas palustris]